MTLTIALEIFGRLALIGVALACIAWGSGQSVLRRIYRSKWKLANQRSEYWQRECERARAAFNMPDATDMAMGLSAEPIETR